MVTQILFLLNIFWIFISEIFIFILSYDNRSFIDRLSLRLANVNILYVKLFQAIALNNDFIDEKLAKFTDEAPWTQNDINEKMLLQLAEEYNLVFKDGFDKPMKAGMISLVYKAYSNDKPLIVKIKRHNIENRLNEAITNLLYFVNIISFVPAIKQFKIQDLITKNAGLIMDQTMFKEEVKNMIQMRENCKNLKYVKIPEVFLDVTSKYEDVIVMEFIDGLTIDKIDKDDYEGFAKQVIKFGLVTSMIHGVAHGDLHRGNILFIKNDSKNKYVLGVIDFGIVNKIEPAMMGSFVDILTDLFTVPVETIVTKILYSGIIEPIEMIRQLPTEQMGEISSSIAKILNNLIEDSTEMNQLKLFNFISDLNSYLHTNVVVDLGLKPCDSFMKFQLTVAMAQGVALSLGGDDYMNLLDEVINELFHTKLF